MAGLTTTYSEWGPAAVTADLPPQFMFNRYTITENPTVDSTEWRGSGDPIYRRSGGVARPLFSIEVDEVSAIRELLYQHREMADLNRDDLIFTPYRYTLVCVPCEVTWVISEMMPTNESRLVCWNCKADVHTGKNHEEVAVN